MVFYYLLETKLFYFKLNVYFHFHHCNNIIDLIGSTVNTSLYCKYTYRRHHNYEITQKQKKINNHKAKYIIHFYRF